MAHMHIESTLGGIALGADGSSWPVDGLLVMRSIANLTPANRPVPTTEQEWAKFLRVLRDIFNRMAVGIMEAQVSMACTFVSAMEYTDQVDANLLEAIRIIKIKTKSSQDPAELMESFANAAALHELIASVYGAALTGEPMDQRAFTERIIGKLRDAESPPSAPEA